MPLDLARIEESDHLLDVLIQMEDVLDSLDIYVYRNWFSGEIVEGPVIGRHWVSFTLLYPDLKMPDPKAILRLEKHGIHVSYTQAERKPDRKQAAKEAGEKAEPEKDWLVKISFPRRLLNQISGVDLDLYDEEVDVDDVSDASDAGIDDETGDVTQDATDQAQMDTPGAGGPDDATAPGGPDDAPTP